MLPSQVGKFLSITPERDQSKEPRKTPPGNGDGEGEGTTKSKGKGEDKGRRKGKKPLWKKSLFHVHPSSTKSGTDAQPEEAIDRSSILKRQPGFFDIMAEMERTEKIEKQKEKREEKKCAPG